MYYRKTAARPFDTIHDILRSLSLVQSLLKGRNSPKLRIGNRRGKIIYYIIINWFLLVIVATVAHVPAPVPPASHDFGVIKRAQNFSQKNSWFFIFSRSSVSLISHLALTFPMNAARWLADAQTVTHSLTLKIANFQQIKRNYVARRLWKRAVWFFSVWPSEEISWRKLMTKLSNQYRK